MGRKRTDQERIVAIKNEVFSLLVDLRERTNPGQTRTARDNLLLAADYLEDALKNLGPTAKT